MVNIKVECVFYSGTNWSKSGLKIHTTFSRLDELLGMSAGDFLD